MFGLTINFGKIFISKDYDKLSPFKFAITLQDLTPNTLLINEAKKYNCFKILIQNFKLGNVYFENERIKKFATEAIKQFL